MKQRLEVSQNRCWDGGTYWVRRMKEQQRGQAFRFVISEIDDRFEMATVSQLLTGRRTDASLVGLGEGGDDSVDAFKRNAMACGFVDLTGRCSLRLTAGCSIVWVMALRRAVDPGVVGEHALAAEVGADSHPLEFVYSLDPGISSPNRWDLLAPYFAHIDESNLGTIPLGKGFDTGFRAILSFMKFKASRFISALPKIEFHPTVIDRGKVQRRVIFSCCFPGISASCWSPDAMGSNPGPCKRSLGNVGSLPPVSGLFVA